MFVQMPDTHGKKFLLQVALGIWGLSICGLKNVWNRKSGGIKIIGKLLQFLALFRPKLLGFVFEGLRLFGL